jgi:hypothetical protein
MDFNPILFAQISRIRTDLARSERLPPGRDQPCFVDFRANGIDIHLAMSTVTTIIKEHRDAAKKQRQQLKDPKAARKFLIRAGILARNGRQLAKRYR